MKVVPLFIIGLFLSSSSFSQSEDYWKLYESYASSDATKYHDILQSLDAGNIEEARNKLLSYQAAEILVLERLQEDRKVSNQSAAVIELVRTYNHQYEK